MPGEGLIFLRKTDMIIKKEGLLMDKIEMLKEWVAESKRIVAFTGAGFSTE